MYLANILAHGELQDRLDGKKNWILPSKDLEAGIPPGVVVVKAAFHRVLGLGRAVYKNGSGVGHCSFDADQLIVACEKFAVPLVPSLSRYNAEQRDAGPGPAPACPAR